MPASIALAIGFGIAATSRPSGDHRPVSMMSTPTAMNAPTAAGKPPGDRAGGREQREARRGPCDRDRHAQSPAQCDRDDAHGMPSTTSAEAICLTDAPTAVSPWITTATELA